MGFWHRDGVILILALTVELQEPVVMMIRERYKLGDYKADSINALHRSGQIRSSTEVVVILP